MEQFLVAVLGCGGMGSTIIGDVIGMPQVKAVIGYDVSEQALKKVEDQYGIQTVMDLDIVLKTPDVRLVYIATPNATHVPLAIKALEAGKAVMTEKPAGLNNKEMQQLIDAAKKTKGFVQVGFECRYAKAYQLAKTYITEGEIGKPVNFHFTYSMPPFEARSWRVTTEESGSMCHEKLCHYIDLVRWWNEGARVNEYVVTSAKNVIPYFEIEDNMHVSYRFDNGVTSQLYFNMTAAPGHNNDLIKDDEDLFEQDRMGHKLNYVITGTEGAIEIDLFQREVRLYHHAGKPGFEGVEKIVERYQWERKEDQRHFHDTTSQNRDIVLRVAQCLPPGLNLEDAAETMRLCTDFTEAGKRGGWEVLKR